MKKILDYDVEIKRMDTTDGVRWVAYYPSLKGVMGGGKTPEEALKVLGKEAVEMVEFMREERDLIPESDEVIDLNAYSGRITLRMSKSMHRMVVETAKREGVSANAWINEAIGMLLGSKTRL
ncbi:MAG: type II toxin-antitoxin system HicB family antitoxin [Erysipelothrix sp.]|nr:type II toxin-antitoxin system HicB family antitoxin [Erysipelothrix sp.]